MTTSTTVVTLEHLGPYADSETLCRFVDGFYEACKVDDQVQQYHCVIRGDDTAHFTVTGFKTALEVTDHVYETYTW